ncbi:MAG: putative Ig domain-containing protein, partial [Acidimicrobiales bacterium]
MRPLAHGRVRIMIATALVVGSFSGALLALQGTAGAISSTPVQLYVNGTTGTMTTGCTGPGATACTTIQEAVTAAETDGKTTAVVITVAAGTYTGGVTITVPAGGPASLTIAGSGWTKTVVKPSATERDISVRAGTVTIEGLSIDTGHGAGTGGNTGGGGVYSESSTLTLTDDDFTGDTATHDGGAVMNDTDTSGGVATATITDDTFYEDSSTFCGGAIENKDTGGAEATATITHDTFYENSSHCGGAVENYSHGGASVRTTGTLLDDIFLDDTTTPAATGGGVKSWGTGADTTVSVSGSVFDGSSCNETGSGTLSGTGDVWTTTTGCGTFLVGRTTGKATVAPTPTIMSTPPISDAAVGVAYGTHTFIATGDTAAYTWSLIGTPTLHGLTFTPSNHTLSGTPTTAGIVSFTLQVTDTYGTTATRSITLSVDQAPIITSAANTTFTVGAPG